MKKIVLAVLVGVAAASSAHAVNFTITATMKDGTTVLSTFDGTASGNLITNLSHITVLINGVALPRNGALFGSSYNLGWKTGGAVVSFDGTQNNFGFYDVNFPKSTFYTGYFVSLSVLGPTYVTGASIDGVTHYNFKSYSVSATAPEPASWAMMVIGFGAVGGALRSRRRAGVCFA